MFHHRDSRGLLVCDTRDISGYYGDKIETFAICSGFGNFFHRLTGLYVNQQLTLSSQILKYVPSHNYLGVTIAANISDDESIHKQCKALYARGNVILRHFRMCSDDVKCLLFSSYCTSFYCSALWCRYKADSVNRLQTAYNRVFRQLFSIRGQTSISQCLISRNLHPFKVILRKSILSLRKRIFNSNNFLMKLFSSSLFAMRSPLHKKWDKCLFLF